MIKRLTRMGELDLKQSGEMHRLKYYELLTRGDWIYYECLRDDGARTLLRFDYDNYQVLREPLTAPVVIKNLHRYKFVPAEDKFYHLEVAE